MSRLYVKWHQTRDMASDFPDFLVVHDGQVPKLPQPRLGRIESGAAKVSDVVRKKVNAAQPRGRNLQINLDQPGSTRINVDLIAQREKTSPWVFLFPSPSSAMSALAVAPSHKWQWKGSRREWRPKRKTVAENVPRTRIEPEKKPLLSCSISKVKKVTKSVQSTASRWSSFLFFSFSSVSSRWFSSMTDKSLWISASPKPLKFRTTVAPLRTAIATGSLSVTKMLSTSLQHGMVQRHWKQNETKKQNTIITIKR